MPDAPHCDNCDLETRRPARLEASTPSGGRLVLTVCAECYLHLRRPTVRPGRAAWPAPAPRQS